MYFKFQAKVWEGIKQLKSFLLARSMSYAAHTWSWRDKSCWSSWWCRQRSGGLAMWGLLQDTVRKVRSNQSKKSRLADQFQLVLSMQRDVNHSPIAAILLPTNKLWDSFCWQSVLTNCENNKELGSLDVMKIYHWQVSSSHSVSDMREIANYIASIFEIKVGDLKMEIITLQTVMV